MAKYNKTLSKRLQRNKGKHVFYFYPTACLLKDHCRLINTVVSVPVCIFLFSFLQSLVLFHSEKEKYLFKIITWLSLCILLRKTYYRTFREHLYGPQIISIQGKVSLRFMSSRIEDVGLGSNICVQI